MEQEIELKLAVDGDPLAVLEQQLLPNLEASIQQSQAQLHNHYFDTSERLLRQHDIGFRVRAKNGKYEQTIKLAGKTLGGLHQRPEFNLALPDDEPDLTLFDNKIWPEDLSATNLQQELVNLFTTHFERRQFLLSFNNGDQIELAIDVGQVAVGKQKQPICEIELELKSGQVSGVFDLAEKIIVLLPARLDNLSKAARGYMLADAKPLKALSWPPYLPLTNKDSLAAGLTKALEHALKHWQRHEHIYLLEHKPLDLQLMLRALHLLQRALKQYQASLNCDELSVFEQALEAYINQWQWLPEFLALKALRSKKGHFRKRLNKQQALLSYLRGRCEGLLQQHQPQDLVRSQQNQSLQLQLSRLLVELPWQQKTDAKPSELRKQSAAWLTEGWKKILAQMTEVKRFDAYQYLQVEAQLTETMQNGYLLASLFQDNREQFRAPWLDLLDGMHELNILNQLKVELTSTDIEELDELQLWCQEKMANLVSVMHQSHQVALKMEPYW